MKKLLKEGFEWSSILGAGLAMLVFGAMSNNIILSIAGGLFGALSYVRLNKIIKDLGEEYETC